MRTHTLTTAVTAAALVCTSAPSFAQAVPEPAASSGELQEEPGFIVESIVIPDGFTAENISGYYLEHDLATDTWTAEFVFESDFTESGYADSGTYDGGGGSTGREITGGQASALDDGAMLSGEKQTTSTRSKVTKTTSGQWSLHWVGGIFPVIRYVGAKTETITTDTTTITRTGRLTDRGAEGRLPPPKW